jgi:hypothetical protein
MLFCLFDSVRGKEEDRSSTGGYLRKITNQDIAVFT